MIMANGRYIREIFRTYLMQYLFYNYLSYVLSQCAGIEVLLSIMEQRVHINIALNFN